MKTSKIFGTALVFSCFSLAVFAPLISAASETTVVNWANSTSYVSSNYDFTPPASSTTVVGTARIYAYDPSILRPPESLVYTPPAGTTGYFNTGTWIDETGDSARTFPQRIFNHGSGDRISFITGSLSSHEGISVFGAVFVSFLKDNFLNGADQKPILFGTDAEDNPIGSLSLEIASTGGFPVRFAVLNDGQWYLSQSSRTTSGTLAISSADILTSTWASWSPTGGANGRLGDAPTTFETLGSEFLDIQGFGYFAAFDGDVGQQISIDTRGFTATAIAIPEPHTYAAALGLVILLITALRRRQGK